MSFHLLQCRFGNRIIYQKYVVSTMACLAFFILHGLRYTLISTIDAMTPYETTEDPSDPDICGRARFEERNQVYLDWPAGKQIYVMSAFYAGYIFQVPLGVIPDLYGAKHIMTLAVTGSALISVSVPFLLTVLQWYAMAGVMMLLGLIQSVGQPAVMNLMSHYVPKHQVSVLLAFAFTGPTLGPKVGNMIANYSINVLGSWPTPFYIWTSLAFLWLVWFIPAVYSTPSTHPFICESEKASLEKDLGVHLPSSIPVGKILSDHGIWALVAVQFGNDMLIFISGTFLPKLMKRAMHVDISTNLYFIAIPALSECTAAIGSGFLSDYLIVNRYLPVTYTRTLYVTCGILVQNIFIIFAAYSTCNVWLFTICFSMAMIAKGVAFPGIKSNILDMTRHYVGTVQGLHNGLASIIGLGLPYLVGYMCPTDRISEWRKTFWLTMVVCLFTTTLYFVWAESERAPWDKVKPRAKKIVLE